MGRASLVPSAVGASVGIGVRPESVKSLPNTNFGNMRIKLFHARKQESENLELDYQAYSISDK